ncbi:hypothetical protein LB467_13860 [Salegentibacter sp. JZCK2]|jgi:hypothetical protein|uniref:hypothetical protein n=1 Tax=Salegentibacter tibetensis TaxID=2873600 RepID=UPI001CC947F3|nr:hypothetical protein [Salegentibacter tibetensis]MBZ9730776.1 hypothetical protein [Salegentibacter tibetensis]
MYKDPMEYKKEDISEILNKPLKISIGQWGSDKIIEVITGEIIKCTLAANPPHQPASFRVKTEKGEKSLSVASIKKIEDL